MRDEVDEFIDSYISALEKHRQSLQMQVQEAREAKLHMVHTQQLELERHAENTRNALSFAEDLLSESSDIEVILTLHSLCDSSNPSKQNIPMKLLAKEHTFIILILHTPLNNKHDNDLPSLPRHSLVTLLIIGFIALLFPPSEVLSSFMICYLQN